MLTDGARLGQRLLGIVQNLVKPDLRDSQKMFLKDTKPVKIRYKH